MSPTYALSWSRRSGSWRQHFFRPAQPSKKASYKETPLAPNWIDTESCTPRSCVCASLCRPNWTGERSCSVSSTWVNYRPDVSHWYFFFFWAGPTLVLQKLILSCSTSAAGLLSQAVLQMVAWWTPRWTWALWFHQESHSTGAWVWVFSALGLRDRTAEWRTIWQRSVHEHSSSPKLENDIFFSSPSYLRFIDLIVVSVVFCWYIQLKWVPSLFFLSVVNDGASIVSSVSHSFSF